MKLAKTIRSQSVLIPVIYLLFVVAPVYLSGIQSPNKGISQQPKTIQNKPDVKASQSIRPAATKCKALVVKYKANGYSSISDSNYDLKSDSDELNLISNELAQCIIEHTNELQKIDLVYLFEFHDMLSIIRNGKETVALRKELAESYKTYADLQTRYDALSKQNEALISLIQSTLPKGNTTGNKNTYPAIVSPIPASFSMKYSIGGIQADCTADDPMRLECKTYKYGGWHFETYMVAMIIENNSQSSKTFRYVIGCKPSSLCTKLVPGNYPIEFVGTDGVMFSNLVKDGEKDSSESHAVYSILQKY